MTYQPKDLEAIRARLAAATPGPWRMGASEDCHWIVKGTSGYVVPEVCDGLYGEDHLGGDEGADLDLIAHAPQDIAALLAEVERLTAQRDGVLAFCDTIEATPNSGGLLLVSEVRDALGVTE